MAASSFENYMPQKETYDMCKHVCMRMFTVAIFIVAEGGGMEWGRGLAYIPINMRTVE